MQIEKLPTWVLNELDKVTRRCVWGKKDGARGVHLINWETMIMPKLMGGANIKMAQRMNWELLAKLAWRMLHSKGALWSELLKSKYGVLENDGAHLKFKSRSSQVWRLRQGGWQGLLFSR